MPAASVPSKMVISALQDPYSNAFVFSDMMESLDSYLAKLPRGHINALEYPQASRDRTRLLRFTLTPHPCLTNPGVLAIDPSEFPGQQATTVIARAMLRNGSPSNEITKNVISTNPKLLLHSYEQQGTEFNICIKSRYDSAPALEQYDTWIRKLSAKTTYHARKHLSQKACVG